jgi:hypothetical protein
MANSITPAGTSRSIFGISTTDIVTGGSVTASAFLGIGKNITNINADNIVVGNIGVSLGGTGNSNFIANGIVFNTNDNRLSSDRNLLWTADTKILKINNRDFLSDTSNYVKSTSNNLQLLINNSTNTISEGITSNITITTTNTSNYVLSTSNILIKYIKTEQANNILYPATTRALGSVQIGDGLYVNKKGVVSITPEIISILPPIVKNTTTLSFTPITGSSYKICKFLYNPDIGTTFDRDNQTTQILPSWYKFTSNHLLSASLLDANNSNYTMRTIENKGYLGNADDAFTALELYGDTNIKPTTELLDIEYTPLQSTYLEFNCVSEQASYGKFERNFDINNVFKAQSQAKITISFWLKVNSSSNDIIIIEFTNNDPKNLRKLSITYIDISNSLQFFVDKERSPIFTIDNIKKRNWYHILWSIEQRTNDFRIQGYINNELKITTIIINEYLKVLGFFRYTKNTISSDTNTSNYNFCISDLKMYNKLLTDDEKTELYNANRYTQYYVDFKDTITSTICDIIAYGGGGGGGSNYGGGAGKLIYVNDAYIAAGVKSLKIGRGGGGYYSNIDFRQEALLGNDTTFEYLKADGGGSSSNYTINYISSNISISGILRTKIETSNLTSNMLGGSGSGNKGEITPFVITSDLKNFVGNTCNIYYYGNKGGLYGGGSAASEGFGLNGGAGVSELIIENGNVDTETYFNFKSPVNLHSAFNLTDSSVGELYDSSNVYIASGGAGMSTSNVYGITQLGYNSRNSGAGGNYGESGKNGAILIRVLSVIDKNVLPKFSIDTSNYVSASSNNIIEYINTISSVSGALLWSRSADNIYYNLGNVGIGANPLQFKLEVAAGTGATTDETIDYGIMTSNNSNILISSNVNNNICAKFNSSIWTSGNVIASSDERIKTNISDLLDDSALQMILNIQPKTYNYIDWRGRGANNKSDLVYGFLAQQIKRVIPDAVKLQTEFIPNIFAVADYDPLTNIITFQGADIGAYNNIKIYKKVKCYDMRNNTIIVEVIEIINSKSFKIKDITYANDKIFVYGTEVNDFHALNKEYINTLNVCAVQELHRKIVSQQDEIRDLQEKVNILIDYIDFSKMATLQDDINELKSRVDLIITYMDMSR